MTDWRFTDNLYLYYSYDGVGVFIANPESKKFYGPVSKISESIKKPDLVTNDGVTIEIRSSGFWLDGRKIRNAYTEDLLEILSGATITSGKVEGVKFGFCPFHPDKVRLIFPGSEYYGKADKEFIRNVSLSLCRKTSKYVPGHKYETESGTFWFLGDLVYHKTRGRFYGVTPKDTETVHAFVNDIPDSKSIDEIYQTYGVSEFSSLPGEIQGKTIILTTQNKTLVDSGMDLILGGSPEDNYKARVDLHVAKNKEPYTYGSGQSYYINNSWLVQIFDISEAQQVTSDQYLAAMMKEIFRANLYHSLYRTYDVNVNRYGDNILSSITDEENAKNLLKLIISELPPNYYSEEYYRSLFKELFGIDLKNLALEVLQGYKDPGVRFSGFSELLENFGYLEYREPESFLKTIDFEHVSEANRKMEKYFPAGFFRDKVSEIYKEAIDTNGGNLKCFTITNIGTSRRPIFRYEFIIGPEDFMRSFGVQDINDLPDDMKDAIFYSRIYRIKFITRSDIKVTV